MHPLELRGRGGALGDDRNERRLDLTAEQRIPVDAVKEGVARHVHDAAPQRTEPAVGLWAQEEPDELFGFCGERARNRGRGVEHERVHLDRLVGAEGGIACKQLKEELKYIWKFVLLVMD